MRRPSGPASRTRRRSRWLAPLLLAGAPGLLNAAVFAPSGKPDTAADVVLPEAAEPGGPTGSGIDWRFAPWRVGGSLALDLRSLRQEDGTRSTSALQVTDIDFASYLWQPWFAQVRLGLGWVASRSASKGVNAADGNDAGRGLSMTGRAALSVFPASRFPFELRADLSDSRASGLSLAGDQRSLRVSVSQSWRPEEGNDLLQLMVDHSTLEAGAVKDRLSTLSASATRHLPEHQFEGGISWSGHVRSDTDDHTELATVRLRHGFQPSPDVQLESLASWNSTRFGAAGATFGSDLLQLSTFGTWRLPHSGLFEGDGPTPTLVGSARWVQVRTPGSEIVGDTTATTVGLSHEFGVGWRASVASSATLVRITHQPNRTATNLGGTVAWAPPALPLAGWRWSPNVSLNASLAHDSEQGSRQLAGVQAGHALSRDWQIGEQSYLTLTATQAAARLHEAGSTPDGIGADTRALAHGASIGWQMTASGGAQSYAALSVSRSETQGASEGRFELVNLQWSQRVPLSRQAAFSANVTAQGTRNESTTVDAFTGERRRIAPGWQPYHSASLSYDHQRFLDVPRLRLSLLLSATSQQIERRAFGDIEAPRERVTRSFEARLDWNVGRLETRLAARVARVDDRTVAALQARAQRRF
ncbi:MAG: hypothetical protein JNN18_19120 [Rubrivivax sp.]|nr:hypothetical protein [Rubrivivax sp.]